MTIYRILAIGFAIAAFGWAYTVWKDLPPPHPEVQQTKCGSISNACIVGDRSYNLLLPLGEGPFPIVIFLHGSNANGAAVLNYNTVTNPLINRGYALIAPTGLDVEYAGDKTSSGWIWEGRKYGRNDYHYLHRVIADATSRFPIDPDKIIIAGHSNGATMAWYLACAGFDLRIKFFASINGTPYRGWRRPCFRFQPEFNLFHMHGASDMVVPTEGILADGSVSSWLGAHEAVADIANRADCRTSDLHRIRQTTTTRWANCMNDSEFHVAIVPGRHKIPHLWADTMLDWYEELIQN